MTRINKYPDWKSPLPEVVELSHCYECNCLIYKSQTIDNLCIDCARKEFMAMKKQLENRQMSFKEIE